jgi:hypothetical protein
MTAVGYRSAARSGLRALKEYNSGRCPLAWLTVWTGLLLGLGAVPAVPFAQPAEQALGARLYVGQQMLAGYIVGHETPLPTTASRCINCHELAAAPAPSAGAQKTAAFGPRLSPEGLKELAARRGGPPTRYDLDAFCELLRTGVDPAKVIIQRAMPRYRIDRPQCEALWIYVTQPRP